MDRSELDAMLESIDDPNCLLRSFQLAASFHRARDWFDSHELPDEATKMQWELEAWSLIPSTARSGVRYTEYLPKFGLEDGDHWPNVDKFPGEQWQHLSDRAGSSRNVTLIAHYSDLIWTYKRDYHRAVSATAAFMALEEFLWSEYERDADFRLGPQWITALFRPLEVAKQISRTDAIDAARERVLARLRVLSDLDECNGSIESFLSAAITRLDLFEPDQRVRIGEHLDGFYNRLAEDDYFRKGLLELRLGIARSLADPAAIEVALVELAGFHVAAANAREPESKISAASELEAAATYYEQLSREIHSATLEQLQRRRTDLLSDESQYSSITHETTIEPSRTAKFLATCRRDGVPDVLAPGVFLALGTPSLETLNTQLAQLKKTAPLTFLIRHVPIWSDGVVEHVPETEEENDEYHRWSHALLWLRYLSFHLLQLVGHLGDRWSMEEVEKVLEHDSLLDESRRENLRRAFGYYFNGEMHTAIILFTLEVEPLLRGVLHKLGLAITLPNPKRGRGAQRAKNLDECLATPELSSQLGEGWVVAAKALLTKDGGQKLRHRVAHGRDVENLIDPAMALTLAAMILWIATFKSKLEDDSESTE